MKDKFPRKRQETEQKLSEKGECQNEREKNGGRKSPWRFLFLGMAVLSGLWFAAYGVLLLVLFRLPLMEADNGCGAVGIIGGADGPTAIYVTSHGGIDWDIVIIAAIGIVGLGGYLLLRRRKK